MRIGASVRTFNYNMRNRRVEMGYTQAELSEITHCRLEFISAVENLRKVPVKHVGIVVESLNKISKILEMPFGDLFPQDYLDAIQRDLLPKQSRPVIWVRDIRLEELPPQTEDLQLPSPEDSAVATMLSGNIKDEIRHSLELLSPREVEVLKLRYGIDSENESELTYEEIGRIFRCTGERIRQIEAVALRRLRHPSIIKPLRELL